MRCIFCKQDSTEALSLEHIIPESLGNTEHVMPQGFVCDTCNQYFALKIEKPFLDSSTFRLLRAQMRVPNKKGRIPAMPEVSLPELPDYRITARLLGKIGLEACALRVCKIPSWCAEVIDNTQLDPLREFVRFDRGASWPFYYRPIYPPATVFREGSECFEVLHEYDLLYTVKRELYIVVAIFGVELVMNLGGPDLDGYIRWLERHDYHSPLYIDKEHEKVQMLWELSEMKDLSVPKKEDQP